LQFPVHQVSELLGPEIFTEKLSRVSRELRLRGAMDSELERTSCMPADLPNSRPHLQALQHQTYQQLMQPPQMQGAWCAGCNAPITEQFLLQAVDRCWHTRCLKCHHCSIPLSDLGSSCYTKGGMILCRTDYIRLFGSHGTCAGCSMHISATEFVLRSSASSEGGGGGSSRVYHVQCFVCSQCRCQLQPGDRYALLPSGLPVCESDFAKAFAAAAATGTAASAASGGVGSGGGSQTAAAAAPATSKRGGGGKKKGGGGGQKQQPPLQPVC
ncbi:hypothetical protein BOX15_Mlig001522g3, partial [Macrostomum lignano]